jgi:hypothetical protein
MDLKSTTTKIGVTASSNFFLKKSLPIPINNDENLHRRFQ